MNAERLEAILVGNAAAVFQGAPVMTADLDFFVRDTPLNRKKIVATVRRLSPHASLVENRPVSDALHVRGLETQIDFMFRIGGSPKFESIRSRATMEGVGSGRVRVAALADVIASKRAANRPKDRAVLPVLEQALRLRRETGA